MARMQANSPGAFFLSATLHGAVAIAVLLFTFVFRDRPKEQPKIFELVAGEGDNYAATEAPALGTPAGINMSVVPVIPDIKVAPQPEPTPPAKSEPVIERAPVPKPPPEEKIRDFSKDVERISKKRQANLEKKYKKQREEEERRAKKEAELKAKRLTKEEFDRLNKANKSTPTQTKVAKVDGAGIAKGVVGGSTNNKTGGAGGKALQRDDSPVMDAYFAFLKQKLYEALEKPPGLAESLVAEAEMRIAADGTLSAARIVKSSGSAEFDRAVLEAIARVRSIGPRPDKKSELIAVTFRMREIEG